MRLRHKRAITLMEVLIVMALLAVALGAAALPLAKALKSEQFARGVDGVIHKITLAAEVMLDFHTDVSLILKKDPKGNGLICHITAALPLPPQIEKGLNHRPEINGIEGFAWNHEPKETLELLFDGTLGEVSKGALSLIAQGKKEVIKLPGYPKPIKRGMDAPAIICAPYPEEIVSAI